MIKDNYNFILKKLSKNKKIMSKLNLNFATALKYTINNRILCCH